MGLETLIILILTSCFGLYMAWNIGANDVANAMGTSVGSGALTLKSAVVVAAILEFGGAVFVGGHVTETVRKGMLDLSLIQDPKSIDDRYAFSPSGIWNLAAYSYIQGLASINHPFHRWVYCWFWCGLCRN